MERFVIDLSGRTVCVFLVAAACMLFIPKALAQQPITAAPADPAVSGAIAGVSAGNVRTTIEKLVSFSNRNTLSSMESDLKPGTGINAAADWIESEFKRISADCGNCLEVKRDEFTEQPQPGPTSRILKPTKLVNVYAILRGTDTAQAARMVLVTGHYDSRNTDVMNTHDAAPGANDDASGVAVSIECARVLSKLRFPATIVFAAVAGEEQGLNGSRHLAQVAKVQGWQLEAVLNNDIVGGDTTPGDTGQDKTAVRVFSEGIPAVATPEQARALINLGAENDSPSRELARAVSEVASTYFVPTTQRAAQGTPPGRPHSNLVRLVPAFHPVLVFRRDRYLRGGDHTSFNAQGFSAVRFTEWRENFDHQHQTVRTEGGKEYGDLLQFVDFDYVANVARLNAATLATLAFAPGEPQEVHVLTSSLDNGTELSWSPPAGMPASAGYEVVWRPTDASGWAMVQSVAPQSEGKAPSIKLPVSKDNVIFGVRSVDAAGHRSVAVMPTPTRPARTPAPAQPAKQ
jgi:hypothetical protein